MEKTVFWVVIGMAGFVLVKLVLDAILDTIQLRELRRELQKHTIRLSEEDRRRLGERAYIAHLQELKAAELRDYQEACATEQTEQRERDREIDAELARERDAAKEIVAGMQKRLAEIWWAVAMLSVVGYGLYLRWNARL